MKRAELVFIPTPAVGHLVSAIEFSKRLSDRSDQFSITILVMKSPFDLSTSSEPKTNTIQSLVASHDRIKIINLPDVGRAPDELLQQCLEKYITVYIESCKVHVREAIANHVLPNSSVSGFVIDMFCTTMIDIANELKVPTYPFITSGAGFLGFLLHLTSRYDRLGAGFEQSGPELVVPSYVNPVPASALPLFALNIDGYITFASHARRFKETNGIIVNTALELESHAVHSLSTCDIPPVYTVGPLIGEHQQQDGRQRKFDHIMKWLDGQPSKSVVFLCFGSFGTFGATQLKEIAIGLGQSGQKFLWSVRQNPPEGKFAMPVEYTNYEEFLPAGFLERTNGVGILCGWAPQVEVLAHRAVGAFVSHCGWNSTLEALWHGVPLVAWPLYAEQHLNGFQIVRDLGLAVALRLDYRKGSGGFVAAEEIEKAVRFVMGGDGGEVRKKVEEMKEVCRKAVEVGGSSYASFDSFVEVILAKPSF